MTKYRNTEPRKYRTRPNVKTAYQWFEVSPYVDGHVRDVDYYRTPQIDGQHVCSECGRIMHDHGFINTLEGGHVVCPGDWVITGLRGEVYACKPDIFEKSYEPVEEK